MNTEVNFHPTLEMLTGFAGGTLSTGMSVAISAHVELCSICRERTSVLEAEATIAWLQEAPREESREDDFTAVIDSIVSQEQVRGDTPLQACSEIHMHERSVRLPRVLARIASQGLVWKKQAGGINQAAVMLDDQTQCEFLYMKPGSQVPVHRHLGNEITLVLDGSFTDELGEYRPSDFVLRDRRHLHQPASEEGCLCFAVLDSPFVFTRGLARLMNPVLRRRFKRATAGSA